jgi:hypothetical protein
MEKIALKCGGFPVMFYLLFLLFYLLACEQPGGPAGVLEETPARGEPSLEPGLLLSVIVPKGLDLTGESRIRIEGEEGSSFTPLAIAVSGTIREQKVPLPVGRYAIDVFLEETGKRYYWTQEAAEIREAEEGAVSALTPFSVEPEDGAFLTGSAYAIRTGVITIKTTAANSTGLTIPKTGGSGTVLTREMAVVNGTLVTYFAVVRKTVQTLTVSGPNAGQVQAASGTADGMTPGLTNAAMGVWTDVFVVDTAAIADTGGSMTFSITAGEPGKQSIVYTITLRIPSPVRVWMYMQRLNEGDHWFYKHTYLAGEPFDPASVRVQGEYSDGSKREETLYEVRGFDSSKPGPCTVQFYKAGKRIPIEAGGNGDQTDQATGTVTLTILERQPPHLFFDYGRRISTEDPVPGRYTVTEGRTLVIAPVLWRIPEGAAFSWTVSGGSYTANGEFLTFNPDTPAGDYTATVTASFDGQSVQASTTVECVNAASPPSPSTVGTDTFATYMRYAPGDHLWFAGSLGGFGGYAMGPIHIDNLPGLDIICGTNAFGGWQEPGVVWVMQDENRNGVADDTWYELEGSGCSLTRRYAVTYYDNHAWEDSFGDYGTYSSGSYPVKVSPITFVGTKVKMLSINIKGYADSLFPYCDISDAVQADGTTLDPPLTHIDFAKTHTGEHMYTQLFGERSTEGAVSGSLHNNAQKLSGTSVGGGLYEYRFVNNSSYDITVTLGLETVEVPRTQTVTKQLSTSTVTFLYVGGNVTHTISGNTLAFTDGAGGDV